MCWFKYKKGGYLSIARVCLIHCEENKDRGEKPWNELNLNKKNKKNFKLQDGERYTALYGSV